MGKYLKLWVYVVIAAGGALATVLGPGNQNLGDLTLDDWLIAAGALVVSGAFTAAVDNIPGTAGGVAKAISAFIGAAVVAAHAGLVDGVLTQGEIVAIVSTALAAAVGVYQSRNDTGDGRGASLLG